MGEYLLGEKFVRFNKWGLFVLISCLGTASSISIAKYTDSVTSDVVDATEKTHSTNTLSAADLPEQTRPMRRVELSIIRRAVVDNVERSGLFQSKTWYTPPPQTQAISLQQTPIAALQPPPSAPALPFSFIGRMIDKNEAVLFLSKNGRQYAVKTGDVIDGSYRVEKFTENDVLLTYLPMNIQQTLAFHSATTKNAAVNTSVSTMALPLSFQAQR
ncbi:MAG: hypothetical protein WAO71_01175 [Gallionella sp.]